jgi:hypothetical protein
MNKNQKIKLIIAVICLIASVAIAALSIGGIVSAATASYDSGKAEGGYAVLGAFAFVIAIMATMVVCTFTLSAGAMLALVALWLFKRMLPDAPEATVANVAYKAPDAPDALEAPDAPDAPDAPKATGAPDSTDSTDSADRPQGAIKALHSASRVIFVVEALGVLALIALFVISAIRG